MNFFRLEDSAGIALDEGLLFALGVGKEEAICSGLEVAKHLMNFNRFWAFPTSEDGMAVPMPMDWLTFYKIT